MKNENFTKLDTVLIGAGLSALNFADTYLEKHKKIDVIAPIKIFQNPPKKTSRKIILPAQMKKEQSYVEKYFHYNNFDLNKNCKVLGTINSGGFSNYWGLQMDDEFFKDQKNLSKKTFNKIIKNFKEFLDKYHLLGKFKQNKKVIYNNEYDIPSSFLNLNNYIDTNLNLTKPILGYLVKNLRKKNLNSINEKKSKLISKNFLEKIKKKGSINFHNYFVKKITKENKKIKIYCKDGKKDKIFLVNKVVLATGTITTTKIILDLLKIKKEIKIKHHHRLFSFFLSKKNLKFKLNFTPSFLQINHKKNKYCADIRPGNRLITESIIDAYPFFKPFKYFLNLFRNRMIFSNILLDSSYSNVFMKKVGKHFKIYSKTRNIKKTLINKNKKIFNFLKNNNVIYPINKILYPGPGADYHYFGTITFNNNSKLSVNENCQLKNYKNVYIIDGSVFDFKTNKYPLGLVISNARRIGKIL